MSEIQLPSPFTFRAAREAGVTRRELDKALSDGEILRLSTGVYASTSPGLPPSLESWSLTRAVHVDRLAAALQRFPGTVASHTSAAVLHGLQLMLAPGTPVDLTTVDTCQRSRRHDGITVHHADSTDTPFEVIDGLRVTPLTRTVVDVLRTRRMPHSVAMLDRAVADGRTTIAQVRAELSGQRRWRGRPRALEALTLVDPVRESWLESFSFVTLHQGGTPLPVPQVEIYDEYFRFVGRVDGLLAEDRTFTEADGSDKYFRDLDLTHPTEAQVRARLAAERRRHERLEALGLVGVRWTGEEIIHTADVVLDRVLEARQRGRRQTFRGWVRVGGGGYLRLEALMALSA